jgi:hypothetical protein
MTDYVLEVKDPNFFCALQKDCLRQTKDTQGRVTLVNRNPTLGTYDIPFLAFSNQGINFDFNDHEIANWIVWRKSKFTPHTLKIKSRRAQKTNGSWLKDDLGEFRVPDGCFHQKVSDVLINTEPVTASPKKVETLIGEPEEKKARTRGSIADMVIHDNYAEKFYKFDETNKTTRELKDKYVPRDIKKEIEEIDYAKLFTELNKVGSSKKRKKNSDDILRGRLNGWTTKPVVGQYRWQLDFKKDTVGLEIETRQNTNLFHDLLKLELGYRKNGLRCGIIISYYRRSVGKLGYGACIEELDRWISELKDIMKIEIPLWVIGLKKLSGDQVHQNDKEFSGV